MSILINKSNRLSEFKIIQKLDIIAQMLNVEKAFHEKVDLMHTCIYILAPNHFDVLLLVVEKCSQKDLTWLYTWGYTQKKSLFHACYAEKDSQLKGTWKITSADTTNKNHIVVKSAELHFTGRIYYRGTNQNVLAQATLRHLHFLLGLKLINKFPLRKPS